MAEAPDGGPEAADPAYLERRSARSEFVKVRGLNLHLRTWGETSLVSARRPALLLLHGWMDVAASFQFMVDALDEDRRVIALDWRGFGLSDPSGADSYWFPDYLADLDQLLDVLAARAEIGETIDLLGHSMGGNVAMLYAGIRPQRIRRLVNLEGFGMPSTQPWQAPLRYARWLDELAQAQPPRRYDSLDAVATRLRKTNPRLAPERARWLAQHWACRADDGCWDLRADPAHRRVNPVLYQREEALACWRAITAPLLWVEGALTELDSMFAGRYPRADFEARLACLERLERCVIEGAAHMLHHDQPDALARRIEQFLGPNP